MSLTFTLWEPAPTAADQRKKFHGKFRWNVKRFCDSFSLRGAAVRWLVSRLYDRYSVKNLNNIPSQRHRSLMMQLAVFANAAYGATYGKPQKKVPRDVLERLGLKRSTINAQWWHTQRECGFRRLDAVKVPHALLSLQREQYARLRANLWEEATDWNWFPHHFSHAELIEYAEVEFDKRVEEQLSHSEARMRMPNVPHSHSRTRAHLKLVYSA